MRLALALQGALLVRHAPAAVADAYGCGDCFAAATTFALGRGDAIEDALALGARCGATVLTSTGPYERQLTEA